MSGAVAIRISSWVLTHTDTNTDTNTALLLCRKSSVTHVFVQEKKSYKTKKNEKNHTRVY